MSAILALLARDWRIVRTYRLAFVMQFASLAFSLVSVRFLAAFVGENQRLGGYGGDYFSFAMLGVALGALALPASRAFSDAVRDAQVTGMLEAMLTTRASAVTLVIGAGIYRVVLSVVQTALLVAIGVVLFGADLDPAGMVAALGVLLLAVAAFAGIGLLSASFVLWSQQREPVTGALLAVSALLSGVLYPVEVLPEPLRWAAALLPLTHALEVARRVLIEGAGGGALAYHAVALALFALLLPLGMLSVRVAVRAARRSGSLAHY